tara:strand:- start:2652 stop:3278 length:627 start_codon:yes stop_codon:yes gene_type:complete
MSKKTQENVVVYDNNIADNIRELITNKHRKVSQSDTPKHFVKKKMGMDYCELSYMKEMAEKHYPGWSWEIIKSEALGSEAYVVHGRLKWYDEGIWRTGDMVAAHRIQKNRGTNDFVDVGNDIKASNTDCFKKALNMYLNIADDVYRNQVEDIELNDEQKNNILQLAARCSEGRMNEIKDLIDNLKLNSTNYKVSVHRLEKELEMKPNG